MTEMTTFQKQTLVKISQSIADQLAVGMSKRSIVRNLVQRGCPEVAAVKIVDTIEQSMKDHKKASGMQANVVAAHQKRMLRGFAFAFVGILITAISYAVAEPGGILTLWWGAIMYGLYDFLNGLAGWLRNA